MKIRLKRKHMIVFLIILLISVIWYIGDVKSGLRGIKNQAETLTLKHLEEKYPNVKFKVLKSYYDIDKNHTYLSVQAREDDLSFSFKVIVNSQGEVNEEFEKNKLQFILKEKVNDILVKNKINDIPPEVMVYPNFNKDETHVYLELSWKEKISKEEFLDKCLKYKELLDQSNINISLYKFRVLSDNYYTLTLGKDERNITKKEILEKGLVQVD